MRLFKLKLKNQMADIYYLWREGYNNIEIASRYNVCTCTISRILNEFKGYTKINSNSYKVTKDKLNKYEPKTSIIL